MNHFATEAHLSMLSHSIARMTTGEIKEVLKYRKELLARVQRQACVDEISWLGVPLIGEEKAHE